MSVVAIFGAGELGGALASKLAARARVREIRLIDPAAGVAAGKALDILQAGPIELSTVSLTAPADDAAAMRAAADAAIIVLADHVPTTAGAPPVEIQGEAGLTLLRRIRAQNTRAPIVCAGAAQGWLLAHAAAELGIAATQIVGSAPHALASALRALVALELNSSANDVCLTLAGTPPDGIIVPWHAGSSQGATLDVLLDAGALRRLEAKVRYLWPPGPYALAAAAARFVEALLEGSPRTFVGFIGPSAHAAGGRAGGNAFAMPIRFDALGRVRTLDLPALSAMQRSTLGALLPR
jgi:malate/lactate dehydrogenase